MRASLKNLWFDPEPSTLPDDPAEFSVLVRMTVGPAGGPGEESFDITVCTPEWLARQALRGPYDARHHVVVSYESFDKNALRDWLAKRVDAVQADRWHEVAQRVGRLGYWEFED
ncbi:Imm8 family immunity protein [Pimelobacter simplex]|uniref:Imm8 family immunity protein n=1 Tax=Nocardioides simplex TaxID=2045 RepID=UPI0019344703|nr:hypothetical protein [Pimelobacter simplex]